MINILFCESKTGYSIMGFLGTILMIIKICVPIILILIGSIELVKCIISNSEEMKKSISKLIKKAIIGLTIFFVPSIVMFLTNLTGVNFDGKECMTCLLETPKKCMDKGNNNSNGPEMLPATYNNDEEKCKEVGTYMNGFCNLID